MIDAKKYRDVVYRIIGAAMKVHEELHGGLLEAVYQEALSWELEQRGIKNEQEKEIRIYYRNHLLEKKYKMDVVVGDVVVELKSSRKICSAHRSLLCNYLRLTQRPVGVLINFGLSSLQGERWALDKDTNECVLVDKTMEPLNLDNDLFSDGTVYKED